MKRAYGALLREYLGHFPCVAVIGPRQCGKTTFLGELPDKWRRFDLEKQADYQLIARDPDLFLRLHPERIALDEAQVLPELFPALRVAIDARRSEAGRFVITGSSSPQLLRSVSESLAGRVGTIEMAPFSCAEAHGMAPGAFFDCLRERLRPADFPARLKPGLGLAQIHDYWLRGGYPEPWLKRRAGFGEAWTEQYVQSYLQRDLARLFPGLNPNRFRTFLQLLSGFSGSVINYSDAARALGVSQPTAREYFEIAHGSFLWRTVPAFEKHPLKRVVKHPKGYLRDSGLLHHFLRVKSREELLGHPRMGPSWEGMVIEELLRGLAARGMACEYFHYRTGGGAEVDLVLEGDFGLVPVEIKYGSAPPSRLRALDDFIRERKCRLGVVINNDEAARLYNDRIVGVPFACLMER